MTTILLTAATAVAFLAAVAAVRAPLVDKAAVCGLVLCAAALVAVVP